MNLERRGFPRYDILAQIRLKQGEMGYIMDVNNLSLSGMFVAFGSKDKVPKLKIGQVLEMDLFASEDLENIKVEGAIVRFVNNNEKAIHGFGVVFTSLNERVRAKLERLISANESRPFRPPPLPPPPLPRQ